jgi:choline dehydrogenase-like flavoprotein
VLATGAIENARLLLASSGREGRALGNEHDLVGRHFMEHPRDYALTLVPSERSPPSMRSFFEEAAFYDRHRSEDGTVIMGRLALPAEALRADRGLQASATLIPAMPAPSPPSSLWGRARVKLRIPSPGRLSATILSSARRPPTDYPRGGPGWSRLGPPSAALITARPHALRRDVPLTSSGACRMRLLLNLEQAPRAENRVVLGGDRDAYGRRLPALHWRWTEAEQRGLEQTRRRFVEALESAGYGRVHVREAAVPDPNAHHHAGTTRMHRDPRLGVVDADCRVHGVENLFIAGASVFPTAGFANPMLTIVALAARLGARLAADCSARARRTA